MQNAIFDTRLEFGDLQFPISRPHDFGLVFEGPPIGESVDYLHSILLKEGNREAFFDLVEKEGLVICKNVESNAPTYRRVRGKSSFGKLSQAEYYHHDGCSSPTKPRVVEIRLPHQNVGRNVATAVACFPKIVRAMFQALPEHLRGEEEITDLLPIFSLSASEFPPMEDWDVLQGRMTRLVRRKLDAEDCRAYFRSVDRFAGAYVLPWEMGESRLISNCPADLSKSMQHRRAYQKPRVLLEQNGSLVKRWTAEVFLDLG